MSGSDVPVTEDVTMLSYAELYRMLARHAHIVLFIRAVDVDKTQKGISNAKSRESRRDADVGLEPAKERINYQTLTKSTEEQAKYPSDIIKMQVSLVERTNVGVLAIKTLEGDEL